MAPAVVAGNARAEGKSAAAGDVVEYRLQLIGPPNEFADN
jgi:hypothetical protein